MTYVPTEADVEKVMPFMYQFMESFKNLPDEVRANFAKIMVEDAGKPMDETKGWIATKEVFAVADKNANGVLNREEYLEFYKLFMARIQERQGGNVDLPADMFADFCDHMHSLSPGEGVSLDDILKQAEIQKACQKKMGE